MVEGMFKRLVKGLTRTRETLTATLQGVVGAGPIDEEALDDLEAGLLAADLGPQLAAEVMEQVRQRCRRGASGDDGLRGVLRATLRESLQDSPAAPAPSRRVPSATPLQSLTMMNGEFAMENARAAARRAAELAGEDSRPEEVVKKAYGLLFSRQPSAQETAFALDHLKSQQRLYARANAPAAEAFEKSLQNLVHMLLTSNEFLYVD